jgi:hypothetical protein|tara:strand:+ start:1655 stop:1870 length:216 start_codon:yes stop_codon:yes gene_type:complete
VQQKTSTNGRLAFVLGFVLFSVFIANLFIAGILKLPAFLSDVQDMLTLFFSVGFFVLGIVQNEAEAETDMS